MKKMTKILFAAGGALLLGGGVANYLLASQRTRTPQEELTLANIEALAVAVDGPSMLGCKERKNSTCYVFDGDGDLVDRRKNEYPGK